MECEVKGIPIYYEQMGAGRQDSIAGYREVSGILDNYPRATFAVLDRAGHHLSFEQKGLFRALASEWLDRVEEYSAGN